MIKLGENEYECPVCHKVYSKYGICTHYRIMHTEKGKLDHHKAVSSAKKKPIWNKGKTKETDPRIAKYGKTYASKYKGVRHTFLTEEAKLKISNSMLQYYKEHPHKGNFSHVETDPEKRFKDVISRMNLPYRVIQYYKPICDIDNFDRAFEIDFYIPELKVSFEINGNYHYVDTKDLLSYTEYHMERKSYIESFGIKQIDIFSTICYNESKLVEIINDAISGNFELCDSVVKEVENYRLTHKGVSTSSGLSTEDRVKLVKNSDISFESPGWSEKLSKVFNVSSKTAWSWVKRYMPEFYKNSCYHRVCKKELK